MNKKFQAVYSDFKDIIIEEEEIKAGCEEEGDTTSGSDSNLDENELGKLLPKDKSSSLSKRKERKLKRKLKYQDPTVS